jgi:hypothetical protein
MATRGFELVYLETHNWGKCAAFWQALGFKLDFEQTDHGHSGLLVADNGTRIFLEEKDLQDPVSIDLYLGVSDPAACRPASPVEVVRSFTATHWGTQVMTVRDPDGRLFRLEAGSDAYHGSPDDAGQ